MKYNYDGVDKGLKSPQSFDCGVVHAVHINLQVGKVMVFMCM